MKKIPLAILIALLLTLTACSFTRPLSDNSPHIGPMQLTPDQQEILDLVQNHNSETFLFEFQKPETATLSEFWIDVYSYGQFVERVGGLSMISNPYVNYAENRLIVSIEQSHEKMRWSMAVAQNGSRASHGWVSFQMSQSPLANARGAITESVAIQDGVEIILHSTIFSHGSLSTFGDKQMYLEHPELLTEYPYVFFIKAKFSTQ